ncbi:hypothetical protein TNCV_3171961 [Trichonephila clavipes]|nr:hypothetical protein TNCV_3171961 [Trichonephila clavipes]
MDGVKSGLLHEFQRRVETFPTTTNITNSYPDGGPQHTILHTLLPTGLHTDSAIIPQLRRRTPSHSSLEVLRTLDDKFPGRCIGKGDALDLRK